MFNFARNCFHRIAAFYARKSPGKCFAGAALGLGILTKPDQCPGLAAWIVAITVPLASTRYTGSVTFELTNVPSSVAW